MSGRLAVIAITDQVQIKTYQEGRAKDVKNLVFYPDPIWAIRRL